MPQGDLPKPNGNDMSAVHRVFRVLVDITPDYVTSVEPDDRDRLGVVSSYAANVLALLRVHHESEDECLWPLMIERVPEHAALFTEMMEEHRDVHGLLDAADSTLEKWSGSGDRGAGEAFNAAVTELGSTLIDHLDREEQVAVPLCVEHLSMEEWGVLPEHGFSNFTGDKIWLILGLIREQMDSEQRDLMLAHMPPPATEMWTSMGERAFTEFTTSLRA